MGEVGEEQVAVTPVKRTRSRKTPRAAHASQAGVQVAESLENDTSRARAQEQPAPKTVRRTPRVRARDGGVLSAAERERLQQLHDVLRDGQGGALAAEVRALSALPDPLLLALPGIRQTLLNRPFDEALRTLVETLASALAPAAAQVWLADATSWGGEQNRAGGQELAPTLRLRAAAVQTQRRAPAAVSADAQPALPGASVPGAAGSLRLAATPDRLVEEVAATRRSVALAGADTAALAGPWRALLAQPPFDACEGPETAESAGALPDVIASLAPEGEPPAALGALVAHPLRARGQFLGVLAVAACARLSAWRLAALEELADLAAMSADRDSLLGYSRSQEAMAQTVVTHAPVAIAVLNGPEHVFALANPTFGLLLGVDDEAQLTGKRLGEVAPDRAASLALSLRLDAVYTSGEAQAMIELPMSFDEGMTYWNVTTTPLPSGGAGVGGVLVAAVDVTRQIIARQRAVDVAEIAQDRIGQMMTLHATSLDVASQLGADPRELLGDILRRSITLLDARAGAVYVRDPRRNELEMLISEGLSGDYIGLRVRVGEGLAGQVALTGHGRIVDDTRANPYRAAVYDDEWTAMIAAPLIHRGQVIGVLDVLDDAERRAFTDDDLWLLDLFAAQAAQAVENARTYVELEAAYRKQRELDRMKDDFIATASHELRTPLTGVQGFLDLLLEFPGSRDDEMALEFLQKASESAQELAEISERLLQTSRLDSGRIEIRAEPIRLAQIVEATCESYRHLQEAQGTAHELLARIPPDVYVQADLGRLKEVLDNLIGNAIKYSPQGGGVLVSCELASFGSSGAFEQAAFAAIEDRPTVVLSQLSASASATEATTPSPEVVAAAERQPYYLLTVRDEGLGIPQAEWPRLFGRFARTEAARTSQIRGTGLGLYICRQMARAMGGDVWLQESAPGQGSVFAVALPAAVAADPYASYPSSAERYQSYQPYDALTLHVHTRE